MERMLKNQKNKEDVISEIINSNVEIEMGASKYIAMLLMEDGYLLVENIPNTETCQTLIYGMITSLNTIEEDQFKYLTVIENK